MTSRAHKKGMKMILWQPRYKLNKRHFMGGMPVRQLKRQAMIFWCKIKSRLVVATQLILLKAV